MFLAHLRGVGVFDPNGDQVGKVRDAVVILRLEPNPPILTGLVVEVQHRRRIFVPMGRVTDIAGGQVLVTGTLNLRRFEKRENETLVAAELLDRQVTLLDTGETVTVLDLAVERTRSLDWLVTQVYVRRRGTGLRRRGESLVVDWADVTGLSIAPAEQSAETFLADLDTVRPADLASLIATLPPKRQLEVARSLEDEQLADVLEELSDDDRLAIVALMESDRVVDVLEEMDADDAADLLGELPPERQSELLAQMEPEDADDIRRLLTYDDFSAGGLMNPNPIILPPDATVADALARVRQPELSPALASQVYVVRPPTETPSGRYLGVCHVQRLLREPPGTLVSAILDSTLEPVGPEASLAIVTRTFAAYNLVALPVVDEARRLLGAVTVDDVIDHMLPEDWRQHEDEEVTSHGA